MTKINSHSNKTEQNENYEEIVRRLADAVIVVDIHGIINFANPAAHQLFGFNNAELIGKSFGLPFSEKEITRVSIRRKLDRIVYVEMKVSLMGETKKRYVVSLRDISHILEAEKTKDQLEKSARLSEVGTLAATVAHELRNPLASIQMAAHNIKRKSKDQNVNKQLSTIEKKIHESAQIINNLLAYSRIKPPSYESLRIMDLLVESIEGLKCAGKDISVVRNIESLRDISIEADPTQIKEVINNLLNNGCDAVSAIEGKIEIAGMPEGEFIKIVIKDNGCGISKAIIGNIFDPFFTTKAKGTGLGLSVCRQIIDMHGGQVTVESESGKGTSFSILLPKVKQT